MKKIYITLFLLAFLFQNSYSQTELACDGERYIDDVFASVSVTTVIYGSNDNVFGVNQNLKMDIYEPVGDTHEQRPVIVFAFGGSFIVGSRGTMAGYCEQFAKKGYVAVTIDYRLGFTSTNEAGLAGAVVRAMGDMKAAIRYFREDAANDNVYKIHPDYILVGGYSAGAIVALHTAYMDMDDDLSTAVSGVISDNGGIDGNTGDSTNQSYSSEVFAVYNLSGALQKKEYIDADETEPLVSYHGTSDSTVPYNHGLANNLSVVDGSGLLHEEAALHGLPNYLKTIDGGGHSDIHNDVFYENDRDEFNLYAHIFLQNQMCPDFPITKTEDIATVQQAVDVFPNPSSDVIQFDFEKIKSEYQVQVFDEIGRLVTTFNHQDNAVFILEKNKIGKGVFFVNVLFEEETIAPLVKRVVFN